MYCGVDVFDQSYCHFEFTTPVGVASRSFNTNQRFLSSNSRRGRLYALLFIQTCSLSLFLLLSLSGI